MNGLLSKDTPDLSNNELSLICSGKYNSTTGGKYKTTGRKYNTTLLGKTDEQTIFALLQNIIFYIKDYCKDRH